MIEIYESNTLFLYTGMGTGATDARLKGDRLPHIGSVEASTMDLEIGGRVTFGAAGKTGVVRYVGEVDSLSGEWVGIELDRPEGKHNGELNGKVYFTCPANHGVFVRKTQVKPLLARASVTATTSSASASSTASRLQQLRDRRASGIGLGGGSATAASDRRASGIGLGGAAPLSDRRASGIGLGGSLSSSRSTTSAVSPGSATSRVSSSSSVGGTPASSGRRTPSASPSPATIPSTRPSTDTSARRLSMSRSVPPPPAPSSPSEELVEARARIAQLEEELEDRNRHVEQLKQNLEVLRETHERRAGDESESTMDVEETSSAPMDVDEGESAADESMWLEKIEAIKQEAEEHVRTVRAELEEHIAQMQAEHEELVDELRLENATQNSEIKTLEAEVTQHKARIAQFTSAEQKKAEEVALAMAKTSAGARKVELLETQLGELQEIIETLTLEKETLEMDKEIAEERVEELLAEVDKLKTSVALAATTAQISQGASSSTDFTEENMKLRAAVKAIHDRSSEEKNELNKKLRQLQRENSELHSLREEVEQLSTKKAKLEGEVEELKELLDVANAYESMVEDLTEKNLTLGERVAELEASVSTLESLKELSEEVEHQQSEYVAELNAKIESQQARIQELRNSIAEQKTVIEDRDRTISRFRDATNRNREEMNQLRAQLRAETGELESLKGTTHSALSQTMTLRALAASARENEAEAAKQRINADQARVENAFLRAAIPTSIFSEMDQKVLRVRLRLGRISGKTDIILQYIRKDIDAVIEHEAKDDTSISLIDSERSIQQLLLADKLAGLSCEAKEDLFLLECHLTTSEEYIAACARLDSTQVGILESALDAALTALADGSLFVSRGGETSAYGRLESSVKEWLSSRESSANSAEGFPMRCAVMKVRAKRSTFRLAFSFAEMLTFVRTVKAVLLNPETTLSSEWKQSLITLIDKLIEEYLALLKLSQHLQRRAEIDLALSDEDLDGSVAVGGDAIELLYVYADECHNLWGIVQEQLSLAKVQEGSPDEVAAFVEQSLLTMLASLKERLVSLFKSVCRGSFTDAISSRTRDRIDIEGDKEGRPQWQIRAHVIHKELLNASSLQASLKEANELSQVLQTRVRELERADSQHRVVAQKLESEVLRLNERLGQATSDKSRLEDQLARERDQFNAALDESHKEKTSLDNANRELRKQLKKSSDIGVSSSAGASSSTRAKSALSQADADAFRKAFHHLHGELHKVRTMLAKERLDKALGSSHTRTAQVASSSRPSDRLVRCVKEVAQFKNQVKARLSMPQMVNLALGDSARDQLATKKLEHVKMMQSLADLRGRVSDAVREEGWNGDVVNAISQGENVFGWRPPEMERPPVLLSRVTLQPLRTSALQSGSTDQEMEDVNAVAPSPIKLLLNQSQVKSLTQRLVC